MSGLKVYSASQIEELADRLKKSLIERRQGGINSFEPVNIVVPNGNVAKWLQIKKFASDPGLCAGVEFPFIEKELTRLMLLSLPRENRQNIRLISDHAYAKAIMSILLEGADEQKEYDKLAPFRRYITDCDSKDRVKIESQKEAAMAWQLAEELSDLMDSYEVYRPEIVEGWLKHEMPHGLRGGEIAESEAALARALWGENGKFRECGNCLSLRQLYNRVKDVRPESSSKTVYFFGHSTFSYLQAQILVWLAKKYNVEVYYRNPCREYWGDIEQGREFSIKSLKDAPLGSVENKDVDPETELEIDNELLKRLGIAGRETLRVLVDLEESADVAERIGFKWEIVDSRNDEPKKVLEKVQESIRCRSSEINRCAQDASIQIVGAPGVRREVEMVYNSILGSVVRPKGVEGERPWNDCSFSDIAVIVPDMQTYRPVIESVFNARGEVPYSILDTSASDSSSCLGGFAALVELGRNGLNRRRLFNVLENSCVQRAMKFSREDVKKWRKLTKDIAAFDGFEHAEKKAKGYFDWSSGLSRLRLARLADTVRAANDCNMPLIDTTGDEPLKFSETVELICRDLADAFYEPSGRKRNLPLLAPLQDDGTRADCWAVRLEHIVRSYLAFDEDDKLENAVLQSMIETLYSLDMIPGEMNFEIAAAALSHFAGIIPCRRGRFLTGGVSVGGFSSLSAIPFRQVYVMGMGAGGFPGGDSDSTLDVRGAGWRLGDVSVANRNRFLFLETLMSVRDRLVLSYLNLDIEKEEVLFPSGLVLDVKRFIGKHVLTAGGCAAAEEKRFQEYENYPLLERGEMGKKNPTEAIVWWADDWGAGILPTYSKAARELAIARAKGTAHEHDAAGSVKANGENADADEIIELPVRDLSEFLKDSVKAVMQRRFGIGKEGYMENDLTEESSLGTLDDIDKWSLQANVVDSFINGNHDIGGLVKKEICRLQLAGKMPTGFLGEYAANKIAASMQRALNGPCKIAGDFAGCSNDAVLRLNDIVSLEGCKRKVRLIAEISNWKETDDAVRVLVMRKADSKKPPEGCLEPFLGFLIAVITGRCSEKRLEIDVADIDNAKVSTWTWSGIDRTKAGNCLSGIVNSFLDYEKTQDGRLVDVKYRNIADAIVNEGANIDWSDALDRVNDGGYKGKVKKFNNDLVIEQNLERLKRGLDGEKELMEIYGRRYELLMSGVVSGAAKEGGR